MKKYFYIILSCILLFIGCKNSNTINNNREINKKNEIKDSRGNTIKEKRYLKSFITSMHFMNNFYGYIKVK